MASSDGLVNLDMLDAEQRRLVERNCLCRSGKPNDPSLTVDGFIYWCEHYCKLEFKDGERRAYALFKLFGFQRKTSGMLFDNKWLWILKARQLGMTTLVIAYVLWNICFRGMYRVVVINQSKKYAQDFLRKLLKMYYQLPEDMRPALTSESTSGNTPRLEFDRNGWGCEIESLAGTENAARSMTNVDLLVLDEASRIQYLQEVLDAAEPTLETAHGQVIGMSTSAGPQGTFYETYINAPGNGYEPVFFPWWERPDRDAAWYEKKKREKKHSPQSLAYEYPATAEDAWMAAGGRCLPFFSKTEHVGTLIDFGFSEMCVDWQFYRAIDWGGVDPFVCLYACVIPGERGFSVDPCCPNTIRELLAWHYDEKTCKPVDADNHCPDALRYLVATFPINGHIHIYREVYEPKFAEHGKDIIDMSMLAKAASKYRQGGHKLPIEFTSTVADRARPDLIATFTNLGIPTIPATKLAKAKGESDIAAGIDRLNVYMCGRNELHKRKGIKSKDAKAIEIRDEAKRIGATLKTEERYQAHLAEHRNRRKKRAQFVHPVMGEDF